MVKRYNKKYYNRTNTCNICGINFDNASGNPTREYNKEGDWTGRWLCVNCWYSIDYRQRPDNLANIIKSLANHRTGNLDPNCTSAKGDLFEELTARWRGIKRLSIENDNYGLPFDHSIDSELGVIETKGIFFNFRERRWGFSYNHRDYREIDCMICYCASKDGKKIERIYIFPVEEVIKRTGIAIYKNPTNSSGCSILSWYERYRVKDKGVIDKINDIWKEINII